MYSFYTLLYISKRKGEKNDLKGRKKGKKKAHSYRAVEWACQGF